MTTGSAATFDHQPEAPRELCLEELDRAVSLGIELPPALHKYHQQLLTEREARRAWPALLERIAAAEERRALALAPVEIVFPGSPTSPDDRCHLGGMPVPEHMREATFIVRNGKLEFTGARILTVQESRLEKRRYRFHPNRTVHFIPADVYEAWPRHERPEAGTLPDDLLAWLGRGGGFMKLARLQDLPPGAPTSVVDYEEMLRAARRIVDGTTSGDILRTWRDNASSAGEASGVLRAMLDKRLTELGADDASGEAA